MKKAIRILSLILCLPLLLNVVACDGGETGSVSSTASSADKVSSAASTAEASSEEEESSEPELGPYDHRTLNLAENVGKWRVTGRTAEVMDTDGRKGMVYDHAAQGFFFQADCEGDLIVRMSTKIVKQNADKTYTTHFLVRVDGNEQDMTITHTTAIELPDKFTIATGLAKGKHTVEIYRCNEPLKSQCVLTAVELNGTLLPYEAPKKDVKIAFIGDSITSGACVYSTNREEDSFIGDPSDASKSYAFVAAQLLNADFTVASRSGTYTINDGQPNSIYWTYDYVSRSRSQDLFDNTKEDVDIFVISLGTNDHNKKNGERIFTDAQIKEGITNLLTRVRADHPKAKIVWTFGQLSLDGASTVKSTVNAFAATDGNTWYYQYTTPNSQGGAWHPTAAAQKVDGEELAAFIKNNVM